MILSTLRRQSLIGMLFDGRSVLAAQLAGSPGHWRLAAAGKVRLEAPGLAPKVGERENPFDDDGAERIAGMLARRGFAGRRVCLAVPEDRLCSGVLELPPRASGAPLEELAAAELGRMQGYEPAQATTFCWDLPASSRLKDDVTQVMALSCRHDVAEALMDVAERASLDPTVLDSRVVALARACEGLLASPGPRALGAADGDDGIAAILNLEWNSAVLGLMYRRTVIYQRPVPEAAVAKLAEALSEELNLPSESVELVLSDASTEAAGEQDAGTAYAFEAVGEIVRSYADGILPELDAPMAYAAQQYPKAAADCLLLTGFGAGIRGLAERLQSRRGVPVRSVCPADVLDCPPELTAEAHEPALTAAVGLAIVISIYRNRETIESTDINLMKW